MSNHNCTQHGHVWLEADGTPYTRHRGRSPANVSVSCAHCPRSAELPRCSQFAGPRPAGVPIDNTIPPGILSATDRALTDAAKTDPTRRAPKPKKRAKKKTKIGSVRKR